MTLKMTLNYLEWPFCVKICFRLGLAYSGFQTKLLGNLQSYAYTFSGKNVARGTQVMAV